MKVYAIKRLGTYNDLGIISQAHHPDIFLDIKNEYLIDKNRIVIFGVFPKWHSLCDALVQLQYVLQ